LYQIGGSEEYANNNDEEVYVYKPQYIEIPFFNSKKITEITCGKDFSLILTG
jgi:alpha-tubulin suppressor-like RCC1 family protein